MNRLLEGKELDLFPLAEYTKQLLKAQDAKTASLVAQEIFEELEEPCPHEKGTLKADCRFCYQAIKSRHGVKGQEWIKPNWRESNMAKVIELNMEEVQKQWQSGGVECRRNMEICECGDYRDDHENGYGKCLISTCPDQTTEYKQCLEFRLEGKDERTD